MRVSLFIMALFHRHPDAVLLSVSWKRSIDMEQQEWVEHKSEARPIPFDDVKLRNERQEKEVYYETVYEYETVTDSDGSHTERLAHKERRTRMVWKWEQLDWCPGRTVEASGDSQDHVRWPDCALAKGEREGERHEEYEAVFEVSRGSGEAGKTHKWTLDDEETWGALEVGAGYHIDLGLFGGVKSAAKAR
jgi:hypothetical protein